MWAFLWRATRGYRFTPWRSPYLKWRIETYWGTPAEEIGFAEFWRFVWQHGRDLLRMLDWVDRNHSSG